MACCNETHIKNYLFGFNLACSIGGFFIIMGTITFFMNHGNRDIATMYMLCGVFILCTSLLGCCGTIVESRCMLITYIIQQLILMLGQMVVVIMVVVVLDDFVANLMQMAWHNDHRDHIIQTTYQCCGLNSWRDYDDIGNLHESCCPVGKKIPKCKAANAHQEGCIRAFIKQFSFYTKMIAYTLMSLACLQFVALILAVYVVCRLAKRASLLQSGI